MSCTLARIRNYGRWSISLAKILKFYSRVISSADGMRVARVDAVVAPLFPRYIFVAIDVAMQRWRAVHSTIGVSDLVCTNGKPVAVPDVVIEQLKSSQDERGLVALDSKPRFVAGDKVHVIQGVFSAYAGVFESMADSERVSVLIEMLGRQIRVALDADAVEAA